MNFRKVKMLPLRKYILYRPEIIVKELKNKGYIYTTPIVGKPGEYYSREPIKSHWFEFKINGIFSTWITYKKTVKSNSSLI